MPGRYPAKNIILFLSHVAAILLSGDCLWAASAHKIKEEATSGQRFILKLKAGREKSGVQNKLSQRIEGLKFRPLISDNLQKTGAARFQNHYILEAETKQASVDLLHEMNSNPDIIYMEPLYRHQLSANPDDSLFSSQYYLDLIQAPKAWDVVKSEAGNVIIAIIDGGTEINHPDLKSNLWINESEIADNGSDDDGNGYIDDYFGWNFANDTGNPTGLMQTPDNAKHGTITAGLAGAATNNASGMAGASWNAKLMAINAGHPTLERTVDYGYEAILYAIINDADIINISWGRSGAFSLFEHEVIQFALDQGAAIIAAAGNDGELLTHYPAAYKNVLAVGATDESDNIASFSNYGPKLGILAPGANTLSLLPPNQFGQIIGGSNGTSFSTPIVAGVAALVKTLHPAWTGTQVIHQLRLTADNLDSGNPSRAGYLGKGRLNAYRAVTDTTSAVRVSSMTIHDEDGDGNIEPGERVELHISLINYLEPVSHVTVEVATANTDILFENSVASISGLNVMEETSLPLIFVMNVLETAQSANELQLRIDFSTPGYSDFEYLSLSIAPSFQTIDINQISSAVTNIGRIGIADPNNITDGQGFFFNKSRNLLYEGAIICGVSATRISNAARIQLPGLFDNDFKPAPNGVELKEPGMATAQETITSFDDSQNPSPLGIGIEQYSFANNNSDEEKFVLLRYDIQNQRDSILTGFRFGLFMDWDIMVRTNDTYRNSAAYDSLARMAYVWLDSLYIGVKLLTAQPAAIALLDNDGDSEIDINDNFTNAEKWQSLNAPGNSAAMLEKDVAIVLSAGAVNIPAGGNEIITFALIGGNNLSELQRNADAALTLWNGVQTTSITPKPAAETVSTYQMLMNYPNPFNPETNIIYYVPESGNIELSVFSMNGLLVRRLDNGMKDSGMHTAWWNGRDERGKQVASGVYLYRLKAGSYSKTNKMLLLR